MRLLRKNIREINIFICIFNWFELKFLKIVVLFFFQDVKLSFL